MKKTLLRAFAVLALLGLALSAIQIAPASAGTDDEVAAAKQRLDDALRDMRIAAQAADDAQHELEILADTVANAREIIAEYETRSDELRLQLEERLVAAFQAGPASQITALLGSDSFRDFTDRLEFLQTIAQDDADQALEQQTAAESLRMHRDELAVMLEEQRTKTAELERLRKQAEDRLNTAQGIYDGLKTLLDDEREALLAIGQTPRPDLPLQRCPVGGINSFTDTFGYPRSGGRTHAGQDLMTPQGTPIIAAHDGFAVARWNDLGGNAVILTAPDGTWTYYAHLSAYGRLGNVEVGEVIGYAGTTGNATVSHLHFEYHPGGGAAVNPYDNLIQVC